MKVTVVPFSTAGFDSRVDPGFFRLVNSVKEQTARLRELFPGKQGSKDIKRILLNYRKALGLNAMRPISNLARDNSGSLEELVDSAIDEYPVYSLAVMLAGSEPVGVTIAEKIAEKEEELRMLKSLQFDLDHHFIE